MSMNGEKAIEGESRQEREIPEPLETKDSGNKRPETSQEVNKSQEKRGVYGMSEAKGAAEEMP